MSKVQTLEIMCIRTQIDPFGFFDAHLRLFILELVASKHTKREYICSLFIYNFTLYKYQSSATLFSSSMHKII